MIIICGLQKIFRKDTAFYLYMKEEDNHNIRLSSFVFICTTIVPVAVISLTQ